MQMIKQFVAFIFACAFSANATMPPRGADQLRELVVFPEINVTFDFGMSSQGNETVVNNNLDLSTEISRLRGELKQQPNNIKNLLQLGNLLDNNDQTNEAQSYYLKTFTQRFSRSSSNWFLHLNRYNPH